MFFRSSFPVATIVLAALLCVESACAQQFALPDDALSASDYALSGQQLLAQGRVAEALLALETALLLNPDLAGAQLDFAQALAQSGQRGAASSAAEQVLRRPDVPHALQVVLRPTVASQPSLDFRVFLQMGQGGETNINSAINAQFLTLQLPNGPVDLPLSDTERPRSASVFKTSIGSLASLALPIGELQLGFNLTNSNPLGIAAFASTSTEASLGYSMPLAPGRLSLQASRQLLSLAHENQFASNGLQLQYDIALASGLPCTLSPRIGAVYQHYPNSLLTDGTFRYVRMQASCLHGVDSSSEALQRPTSETQVSIGMGVDAPKDPTRPGAERQRQEFLLRHERSEPAGLPGQLTAWIRLHATQDAKAYSPLFGALIASTRTVVLGAGYWVPMGSRISLGLELESTRQTSNLGIYTLDNQAIYMGLRWSTP